VLTNDDELMKFVDSYRDQGKGSDGLHSVFGNSARITEFGAALGVAQIRRWPSMAADRRSIIDSYLTGLSDVPWLSFPWESDSRQNSGYKLIGMLDDSIDRHGLVAHLRTHGIGLAGGVYDTPLHRQPIFAGLVGTSRFPLADWYSSRHVCLPVYPGLTPMMIDRVVSAVAGFGP